MVLEGTSVGLDVHARSIVAGVLDSVTGEVWSRRLPPATGAVVGWIGSLPGPVGVAFEAGPTGFGLARALQQVGVRCVVVAPSKEGAAWTQAHQRWLHTQSQQLTPSGLRVAFDEADGAVLAVQARRDRLDAAIVELAMTPPWALLVGRLGCLRGIGVLTGFGLAVEIGDWQRFTGATIGADLGLVPTEQSSGTQRVQGSITKTGNRATVASISAGPAWTPAASAPPSAWSRSPANWLDGAGAWPSWRPDPSIQAGRWGGTHQRVERPATPL